MHLPLGNGRPVPWQGTPRGGKETGITTRTHLEHRILEQAAMGSQPERAPRSSRTRSNARLSRRDAEPANVGYADHAFGHSVNRPAQNGRGSGGRRTDYRPANLTRSNPADSATLRLRKTDTRNEVTVPRALRVVDHGAGRHAACPGAGGMVQEANALPNRRDTQTWTTAVGMKRRK
jgi:hypothetical protein